MPFERVTAAQIKRSHRLPLRDFADPLEGAPCREFGLRRGNYTDDTQSTRISTIAITECGYVSRRIIAEALSAWLYKHALGQQPRYPGQTTRKAMKRFLETNDAEGCGCETPSCGAAIRIAPVAIWAGHFEEQEFIACITDIANVTHTGQTAVDGAVIVATLIKAGLAGISLPLEALSRYCKSRAMLRGLRKVEHALASNVSADELVQDLGGQTGAHEVVPLSIFHIYKNRFKFPKTMTSGLNTFHPCGIDMDSVLSVAGSISGIYDPAGVERCRWLRKLEDAALIAKEALRFAQLVDTNGAARRTRLWRRRNKASV